MFFDYFLRLVVDVLTHIVEIKRNETIGIYLEYFRIKRKIISFKCKTWKRGF